MGALASHILESLWRVLRATRARPPPRTSLPGQRIASTASTEAARVAPPLRFFRSPQQQGATDCVCWVRHAERIDHTRHGASWRASVSASERLDPPLSARGLAQAEELAAWWLKRIARQEHRGRFDVTCVLTSPFLRCRQTARVLAKALHSPVFIANFLSEWLTSQIFGSVNPAIAISRLAYDPAAVEETPHVTALPQWSGSSSSLLEACTFPESRAALQRRVEHGLMKLLRCIRAIPVRPPLAPSTTTTTTSSSGGQMRFPSINLIHPEIDSEVEGDTVRSVRLLLVTHADVIAAAVHSMSPRSPGSDLGLPAVPYASITTLERGCAAGPADWQLKARGDITPLARTKVVVRHERR